jgi:hypothetical protein
VRELELGPARRAALAIGLALAGWIVGMLPYLYCFVAPENLLAWQRPTDARELLAIVLREQYGGAIGFSGAGAAVPVASHLGELARTLARSGLYAGLPLSLGALGYRIVRPADAEPRAGWVALAATFALAGPVLATRFDVPTADFGLHIVHRFHLLPALLLVIPLGAGISLLAARIPPRRGLAHAGAHLVFVAAAAAASVDVARFRTPAMENIVRNTLRSMPPNAVIMAPIVDELDVGTRYLQLARGERPDVLFFRWPDIEVDWYRRRLVPYGLPAEATSGILAAEAFFAAQRPVFAYWSDKELRAHFASYTYGVLVRILPRMEEPPPLVQVFETNRELFGRFDFAYPLPGRRDEFATWVHRKYAGTWARLADELAAAGLRDQAATAIELAKALSPQR